MDNQTKLDQTHSQVNDRKSWLFTHIAETILDYKFPALGTNPPKSTSLRLELSWLAGNFGDMRSLFKAKARYIKSESDSTIYLLNPDGKLIPLSKAQWNILHTVGERVDIVDDGLIQAVQ